MKTIYSIIAATLLLTSVNATSAIPNIDQTNNTLLLSSTASIKAESYKLWIDKLTMLKGDSMKSLEAPLNSPLSELESNLLHISDLGYSPFKNLTGLININ